LYEDEGVNNNYEKGAYATIQFQYKEGQKTLTIEKRKGSFAGMLAKRKFEIVWITKDKPLGVGLSAKPFQIVEYVGDELKVKF
jgi:alpha-D-xyloside xylohydrolase